jgi:hypothetical protein
VEIDIKVEIDIMNILKRIKKWFKSKLYVKFLDCDEDGVWGFIDDKKKVD